MEQAQVVELKRFAKQLQETGGGEETRAAARAILLLADEVESLKLALADERESGEREVADESDGGVVSWFRRTLTVGSSGENGNGSE